MPVFLYQNERGDKDFTPDLDLFTQKQIEIKRRKELCRDFASKNYAENLLASKFG